MAVPLLGVEEEKKGRFTFRCPVCRKKFTYDEPLEPLCTGPHSSLDEHEPAVMIRISAPPSIQLAGREIVLPASIPR